MREGAPRVFASLDATVRLNSAIKDFADVPSFASATSRLLAAVDRDAPPARGPTASHPLVEPVGAGLRPAPTAVFGEERALVAIVGPTASGKSALALELGERLGGEIVNCDSIQVYRGVVIGAGKLMPEERRGIPHHLLDLVEPSQVFTAGDYMREARKVLASIHARRKLPIIVGGTGLYLRALFLGLFEGPARSETLREGLRGMAERRGREFLHRLLRRLDSKAARCIGRRDTQKIIRALEVCIVARQPLSRMHGGGRKPLAGVRAFKIGLDPNRAELYQRVNARVESMFAAGIVEETRALIEGVGAQGLRTKTPAALVALGYKQAACYLSGKATLPEAIAETQKATRRYAKRQWTWFRREPDVAWFRGFGDDPRIQAQVLGWLRDRCDPRMNETLVARSARPPEGE